MGALLSKCKCSFANESQATTELDAPAVASGQEETSKRKDTESHKPEAWLYNTSLMETLNSFRHQGLFVDFSITVDGKDFPVHKNVLAASCKFFRDLFKVSVAVVRYQLVNVDPSAVEDVLNFLYTGKCRLSYQKAEAVLRIADILVIRDLREALEKYLYFTKDNSACGVTCIQEFFASRKESILKAIMEFWRQGLFCDLRLITSSGRVVPVHKNILATVSCYFQGLLRSDMKEVLESNVHIGIVDEAVVNELLNFIYSGEITITFENVKSLLHASDYLLIEGLGIAILIFLKSSSTLSNFWLLFELVQSFSCLPEIKSDILQMTCSDYWQISQSEEFLEVTEEDMELFLSNDDIVSSETQMLESLIRWYKYSKAQRKGSLKNLLGLIHMSSIPDLYLKFLAEKEGIDDLHSYSGHQLKAKSLLDDLKRTAHFYNLAVFGFTRDPDCPGNQLCYWLPFAGPWSYITSLYSFAPATPLVFTGDALYLQMCQLNPKLVCFRNPLSFRFFSQDGTFSLCPPTLTESTTTGTQDSTAVALDGYIYFIGGILDNGEVCNSVQRYNVLKQSWEPVSSMQERRYYHSAVSYRNTYIYVFGGIEGIGCINRIYKTTVERYDPQQDSWSYVASMLQPRRDGLACVYGDKIFVIGGASAECACPPKCEIYDPITDQWQMGCFQILEIFTLKTCKDSGTFCTQMFCENKYSAFSGVKPTTSEPDPFELKVCVPQDEDLYDHAYLYQPSVTCCNGFIIVFGFGSFSTRNLRLPFYFVDPDTGNFKVLYSWPSWPNETSRGIIMPLSRRDMVKALKDYPGNLR